MAPLESMLAPSTLGCPSMTSDDDNFSYAPPSKTRHNRSFAAPSKSHSYCAGTASSSSSNDHLKYMFQAHQQQQQGYHRGHHVRQPPTRRVSYNATISETHAIIDDVLNIVGLSEHQQVVEDDDISILTEATTISQMKRRCVVDRAPPGRSSSFQSTTSIRSVLTSSNHNKSNKSSKTKKRVTFVPKARVYPVLHIQEYTNEEMKSTWYNKDDMVCMQSEIKEIVNTYIHEGLRKCLSKYECIRGLECRFPQGSKSRSDNKRASRQAVILEQSKQRSNESGAGATTTTKTTKSTTTSKASIKKHLDENQIALVYMLETRHCQVSAHEIALEDEEEVVRMYNLRRSTTTSTRR